MLERISDIYTGGENIKGTGNEWLSSNTWMYVYHSENMSFGWFERPI